MPPSSPKSPRPPSRVLRTPSTPTLPRPPKRLAATSTGLHLEARRIPSTPQLNTTTMTPKRAEQTTPSSIFQKKSQSTTPAKSPKRAVNPDVGRGVVKKRIVGELTPKRVVPSVKSPKSITRSKSAALSNSKDKQDTLRRTKSDRKLDQMNRRRSPNTSLEPDTKTLGSSERETDVRRASNISKKRQPKVTFHSSINESPPSKDAKKDQRKKSRKRLAPQSLSTTRCDTEPSQTDPAEQECPERGESAVPKPKKKKKRPTAGRFDLRFPEVDNEETVSTPSKKSVGNVHNEGALSPDIVINEAMTESKLQLLESSPLNRLIPEKDRKAAAAEVASQKKASARKEGKRSQGLNSKDLFVPLDPLAENATSRGSVEDAKLDAARKKEARKLKQKTRQMRKRGELPDSDGKEGTTKQGVVYLGHIPHGFYEKEMRGYFSQFGEVTRLKLSRSRKTGRSRGFAFLEFADSAVASIAAEAMDGYLMHGQALVAKVVPEEEVHPETFKGADRVFRKIPWSSIERRNLIARAKDPLKLTMRSRRVKKKTERRMKSLSKKGITYDFPELSA